MSFILTFINLICHLFIIHQNIDILYPLTNLLKQIFVKHFVFLKYFLCENLRVYLYGIT